MSHMPQPVDSERLARRRRAIRSPRAAAIAGILFAVLFTFTIVLIRLSVPEELSGRVIAGWSEGNIETIRLALTAVPFAGIAFLWFMGVVRDRLGEHEDQFFATIFMGSGLLFLAMMFIAAAIAGGILVSYEVSPETAIQNEVVNFGRAVMYTITNVYGVRMAAVFMISLGTLWRRTGVMKTPFVMLTYALAAVLMLAGNLTAWLTLAFPAWVFVVSVYILVLRLRTKASEEAEAALSME